MSLLNREITKRKWEDIHSKRNVFDLSSDEKLELEYALRHISNLLKNGEGLFLEAGCGTSRILPSVSKRGIQCVGVDISADAVKNTKLIAELEDTKANLVQGNILNLPFRDNSFSFIYSGGVIEHVQNTLGPLKEFCRCLKPGGMLSITVPCFSMSYPYLMLRGNIPEFPVVKRFLELLHVNIFKGKYLEFGYEKSFTPGRIRKLITEAGFTNIEIGLFRTYYPLRMFASTPKLRSILSNLAVKRPFWPMIYVNCKKKSQ